VHNAKYLSVFGIKRQSHAAVNYRDNENDSVWNHEWTE